MKHNKNTDSARSSGHELVPVHFGFTHPSASSVCVAGSFNHWQPGAKPLHRAGPGHWWKEMALAPGTYEYLFVVDGQWTPDPAAQEAVPNPFGGRNSILKVSSTADKAAHGVEGNPKATTINKQKTGSV